MPGSVFIPFHFFEVAANWLTHSELDPVGKIPEFKVCAVKVEPLSTSTGVSEEAAAAAP
jgi:predicted molibdopterin-dependent oxidoreductase YjgC